MKTSLLVLFVLVASIALFGCLSQPLKQAPSPVQNVTVNITEQPVPPVNASALSDYSDYLNDTLDQALIDLDDVS